MFKTILSIVNFHILKSKLIIKSEPQKKIKFGSKKYKKFKKIYISKDK